MLTVLGQTSVRYSQLARSCNTGGKFAYFSSRRPTALAVSSASNRQDLTLIRNFPLKEPFFIPCQFRQNGICRITENVRNRNDTRRPYDVLRHLTTKRSSQSEPFTRLMRLGGVLTAGEFKNASGQSRHLVSPIKFSMFIGRSRPGPITANTQYSVPG